MKFQRNRTSVQGVSLQELLLNLTLLNTLSG